MTVFVLVLLVLAQVAAGAYAWRLIRDSRNMSWVELVGMGIAVGTAMAVLGGCLGFMLPVGSWVRAGSWALPAFVVAIIWSVRRVRGVKLSPIQRPEKPESIAVAIGLILGGAMVWGNFLNYPLSGASDWTSYHQDMVFFEALSVGTSRFSPIDSIFMTGAEIRYHWLTYAWVGQLSSVVNAEPFVVLTRVLPVVALLGTVLIVVAWARRSSSVAWVPTLAVILVVTGGYVGAIYGAILNFDSPSQALTTMWLLGLLMGLLLALQGGSLIGWWGFALVMSAAVAGGKFSTIVVAAGGFGLVTVVGLVKGAVWRWRAVLLSGAGLLAVGLTYVLLVSGSAQAGGLGVWSLLDRASSVQGLNPQTTPRGIIAGTALLLVAMSARWAGVVWLVIRKKTRAQAETVMALGLLIVAIATIALVSGGFNDMWFALAASAPLAIFSAVGLGAFAEDLGGTASRRPVTASLAYAALLALGAAVLVSAIWGTGAYAVGGWRWAAPLVGVAAAIAIGILLGLTTTGLGLTWQLRGVGFTLVAAVVMASISRPLYLVAERVMTPETAPHDTRTFAPVLQFLPTIDRQSLFVISAGQRAAGTFLRSESDIHDIVATNVTYSPLVPALTGLRTYITGVHYQAPYGRSADLGDIVRRERQSWAFVDSPSLATMRALCDADVRWIWIDRTRTSSTDWQPWAKIAYISADVAILELSRDQCGDKSGSVGAT